MSLVITTTISSVRVDRMIIDPISAKVVVFWTMIDDTGLPYKSGEDTFWMTMPDPDLDPDTNEPLAYPVTWHELPASYIPELVQLVTDGGAAISARLGV
jgi:hypothetical protein